MSNTIYLDINAKNSKIHTSENNVMTYELPEAISIPTGTEVRCLQSIVNQQGTVGTSITLEEDIMESIIIQYYVSDTTIQYPTPSLNIANPSTDDTFTNWQVLQPANFFFNPESQFGSPTVAGGTPWGTMPYGETTIGGTEIIMPLVMPCEMDENGTGTVIESSQYLIPMTCEIPIHIQKGTYNVNKLAEFITDQINGLEMVNNNNLPFRSVQLNNGTYNGYVSNGTTLKPVIVIKNDGFVNFNNTGTKPADFNPYRGLDGNLIQPPQPLKPEDSEILGLSAIAVHPKFAQEIRQNAVQGYLGANVPPDYNLFNVVHKNSTNPNFFQGFNTAYTPASVADQFQTGFLSYNPFNNGLAVGATNFALTVNQDGEFQIDNTHTPRYIPTYDYFGNKQENAGQEACYIKRVCGTADFNRVNEFPTGRTGAADPIGRGWYKTLSQPMRRTTGFMVLNWAYSTCYKLKGGNPFPISGQNQDLRANLPTSVIEGLDKNRTFDEWFSSKQEAREAWETTLWYRLGFTYDDIQNQEFFETQYYPDKVSRDEIASFKIEGFTTNERLDVSALTSASTLVNGQAHSSSTGTTQNKDTIVGVPSAINGIQSFNTIDVNVPYDIYNNNKKYAATFGSTTGAYKGSFYYGATMVPVITEGIPVSASRLPVLSNNGYMLVVSDLVEPNDIVKSGSFLGLLDILPKSNLQNTDYIQDRNVLSHTISNPQVIKSITIKIVNPDLTNIELEPNSAFLLSITFPQPKQTILLSSLENNASEQQVASSLQNATAQAIKEGTLPNLPTFEPYNVGIDVAQNSAQKNDDLRAAGRRRVQIAKLANKLNALDSEEEKQALLNKLPEGDRRDVVEVADRIKTLRMAREKGATSAAVAAGGPPRAGGGERPELLERRKIFQAVRKEIAEKNPSMPFVELQKVAKEKTDLLLRQRRDPSPEPSPEALERERLSEERRSLRPRGVRGRFKGQVIPLQLEERVIERGGRTTTAEERRKEPVGGDSGIGTGSGSAEPRP